MIEKMCVAAYQRRLRKLHRKQLQSDTLRSILRSVRDTIASKLIGHLMRSLRHLYIDRLRNICDKNQYYALSRDSNLQIGSDDYLTSSDFAIVL